MRSAAGGSRLRRRLSWMLAAALVAAVGVGCGGSDDSNGGASEGGGGDDYVVGHSFPDLENPYYISLRDSIEEGLSADGMDYVATDSRQDPTKQITDIENLVARGVDVLFIDAVDPEGVVPGLEAANRAGIPVVAVIKEPVGGEFESFIFMDAVEQGRVACEYLVEQLAESGKVVEIQGLLSTGPGRDRSTGCNESLDAASGIELVAQQEGDWLRVPALDAMQNIIQANRDIDGVFAANDEMALGALEALKAANLEREDLPVIGMDGTEAALQAMCEGRLAGTYATIAREEGDIIVDLAKQSREGEELADRVEFEGVMTTPENVLEIAERSGIELGDCSAAEG